MEITTAIRRPQTFLFGLMIVCVCCGVGGCVHVCVCMTGIQIARFSREIRWIVSFSLAWHGMLKAGRSNERGISTVYILLE